jgi:hypothetical protein
VTDEELRDRATQLVADCHANGPPIAWDIAAVLAELVRRETGQADSGEQTNTPPGA